MPILDSHTFECISHGEEQTQRLGARLGALLPAPAVVALVGALGAGKTQFARGMGIGWGALQPLRSPTFTLIQEHHRSVDDRALYHIDLYRVDSAAALQSLGLEEILADEQCVCIIEWAERAQQLLPPDTLYVKLEMTSETKRLLTFSTQSAVTWPILLAFRHSAFGV